MDIRIAPAAILLTMLPVQGFTQATLERTRTLASSQYSVTVQDGAVVSLTNRRTGDTLVHPATAPLSGGLHRLGEPEVGAGQTKRMEERVGARYVEQSGVWADRAGHIRARIETRFKIEAGTGDLRITQVGEAVDKGLYGISWSLGEVPDSCEVLAPGNSGQRFCADAPAGVRIFDYPMGWETPFVLIQDRRGGVLIRAEDLVYHFKTLTVEHTGRAFRLGFESRNLSPFEENSPGYMNNERARLLDFRLEIRAGREPSAR